MNDLSYHLGRAEAEERLRVAAARPRREDLGEALDGAASPSERQRALVRLSLLVSTRIHPAADRRRP
jgi:hypothetical protein